MVVYKHTLQRLSHYDPWRKAKKESQWTEGTSTAHRETIPRYAFVTIAGGSHSYEPEVLTYMLSRSARCTARPQRNAEWMQNSIVDASASTFPSLLAPSVLLFLMKETTVRNRVTSLLIVFIFVCSCSTVSVRFRYRELVVEVVQVIRTLLSSLQSFEDASVFIA